jgi:hypothetical protein
MWTLNLSEPDARTLASVQILVPVIVLIAAWAAFGIQVLGNQIAAQATYEQTGQAWRTSHAEDVVAAYTIWLVVVTGLLALFTAALFVATYALFRTAAKDSERALKQARDLFATERRAWIQLTPKVTSLVYEGVSPNLEKALVVNIQVRRENVGLTPAINVGMWIEESCASFNLSDLATLRAKIEQRRNEALPVEATLFPREFRAPHHGVTIGSPQDQTGRTIERIVFGWCEYQTAFDEKSHFTPFIWQISIPNLRSQNEEALDEFIEIYAGGRDVKEPDMGGVIPHHLSLPPD